MTFSTFIFILPLVTLGWTVGQPGPNVSPYRESSYNPIRSNRSLRNTAIEITDFGCGKQAFCNSSLANYSSGYCFHCSKCHCDVLCSFYGDCCVDRLFDESIDLPTAPFPHITCQGQHLKYKGNENNFVVMVTSCPDYSTANPSTVSRCEEPAFSTVAESTPVSVRASQITYRNVFCAMCHGQTEYLKWRHQVKCWKTEFLRGSKDKDELWSAVMSNPSCFVERFSPPSIVTRPCYNRLVDQCNKTGIWQNPDERVEQLCKLYTRPVKKWATWYTNIFCSVCNGNILSRDTPCRDIGGIGPPELSFPLSVLIDFNPKPRSMMDSTTIKQAEPRCNHSALYDPISDQCRAVQCPYGRMWTGSECELILESAAGVGYTGSVVLTFSENLSEGQWHKLLDDYVEILRHSLVQFDPFLFPKITRTLYVNLPDHTDYRSRIRGNRATGAVINYNIVSASSRVQVLDFEQTLTRLHVHEYQNLTMHDGVLTVVPLPCPSLLHTLSISGFPLSRITSEINLEVCERQFCDFSAVHYEPVLNILDCPHLVFNLSHHHNVTVNSDNSSISISNQTIYLQESDYWACDDVIKICARALSDIAEKIQRTTNPGKQVLMVSVSPVLTIVSVVCIALSLICLLMTFIVYCLLSPLRTLPGKNTMVLVVYLFCAQLLFQVGVRLTYNVNLCRAMGVLIHYFWITSFICMGTCAFHMYRVFTVMSAAPFENTRVDTIKMVRYLIVSNVIAVVVVAVCIAYNAGLSAGREIGYGGDICFLSNPFDIGIFFAGPLGLVLVFNTFCFIRVTLSIRNVPDMNAATHQTNRNHMTIYFRLSVLLGFTWIFGFVAAAIQLDFLWYIFVILNGLQGVFIFIGYCVKRRVWDMLRARFRGKTSDKYSSGSGQISNPMVSTVTSSM